MRFRKPFHDTYPQPFPSLELNQPELQLIPDEWRIARSGLTRTEVASSVRAFTGGLWAGEYFDGNERLDIIVKASEWRSPEELAELPIVTPTAGVQTVGELVELRQTVGPSQLVRINGHRTVSVNFEPPDDMTFDEALARVRDDVEPKVRAAMKPGTQLTYAGQCQRPARGARRDGAEFPARARDPVRADGRALPLGARQPARHGGHARLDRWRHTRACALSGCSASRRWTC